MSGDNELEEFAKNPMAFVLKRLAEHSASIDWMHKRIEELKQSECIREAKRETVDYGTGQAHVPSEFCTKGIKIEHVENGICQPPVSEKDCYTGGAPGAGLCDLSERDSLMADLAAEQILALYFLTRQDGLQEDQRSKQALAAEIKNHWKKVGIIK